MSVKINRTPTDREWKLFTIFGSKKNYFSTETYFRESFFDGYGGNRRIRKKSYAKLTVFS
ncbi:Uncharacterised protein [Klebsiella pneumoniae]|nr:Uncharacterised protein [Klebsiella pneumoniae]